MKTHLILIIMGLFFLLVGSGLIVGGVVTRNYSNDFFKSAKSTTATIDKIERYRDSDGESEYDVLVSYEAEGQYYDDIELDYYNSSMYQGQQLTVYYQATRPNIIKTKVDSFFIFAILIGMGSLFALIGLILSIIGFNIKPKQRLKTTGICYNATVTDIIEQRNVTVNGRHPYYVDCLAHNHHTGQQMLFRSKGIFDGSMLYKLTTVPVYVDPKNPKKYYVDVYGAIEELKQKENIIDYR